MFLCINTKLLVTGLVQKILPLPYDTALKYTIAKYYTPSGRCIQAVQYKGGREVSDGSAPMGGAQSVGSQNQRAASATIEESAETNFSSNKKKNTRSESTSTDTGTSTGTSTDEGISIPDSDRHTFYTLYKHRPVRDGGGIEPDVMLPSNELGAAETLFQNYAVYGQFAQEFVQSNNVRGAMKAAALSERITRMGDAGYSYLMGHMMGMGSKGNMGGATSTAAQQYYVANHDVRVNNPARYSASGTLISLLPPSLNMDTVAGTKQSRSSSTNNNDANNINTIVPQRFFWGAPQSRFTDFLTYPNRGNSGSRERMYQQFKKYVLQKMDAHQLPFDVAATRQIEALENTMDLAWFKYVLPSAAQLKPRIKEAFLADMDKNRNRIGATAEAAVLSCELPSRLIFYHAVIQDPQVSAAARLVSGGEIYDAAKKDTKVSYETIL